MLTNPEKLPTEKYETPAVIYDGMISTRAGTPTGGGDTSSPTGSGSGADGVDPADLFD